jgi:hypothetical protein
MKYLFYINFVVRNITKNDAGHCGCRKISSWRLSWATSKDAVSKTSKTKNASKMFAQLYAKANCILW